MYDLPIEFTEVLTVLTDLHLLKTGTIMSTWKRIILIIPRSPSHTCKKKLKHQTRDNKKLEKDHHKAFHNMLPIINFYLYNASSKLS